MLWGTLHNVLKASQIISYNLDKANWVYALGAPYWGTDFFRYIPIRYYFSVATPEYILFLVKKNPCADIIWFRVKSCPQYVIPGTL